MAFSFSDEALRRVEAVRKQYPTSQAALLPTLWIAQRELGYLSVDALDAVARVLQLPPAKVHQTASFYTLFQKRPIGRHHIQVCTGLSCMLRGADDLLAHIEKRLDIKCGERTPDGRFSLESVECLASCGTAPAMQINGRYVEEVTPSKVDDLLQSLSKDKEGGAS